MSESQNNSLAFNLGSFFGHIVQAVKTDVTKAPSAEVASQPDTCIGTQADAHVIRKQVGEARLETQQGPVMLRRTIIDEVRAENAQRD